MWLSLHTVKTNYFHILSLFYKEELHNLHRTPNTARVNKSRRLRWAGHVSRMKEVRGTFKILTGKPTRKIPLGRLLHRWDVNIRVEHHQISRGKFEPEPGFEPRTSGFLFFLREKFERKPGFKPRTWFSLNN